MNLSQNLDAYEKNPLTRRLNIFSIVAYSLTFALGTLGNGLVIFITRFRMKRTVNTVWILNLAIADFTFSFSLLLHIVRIGLEYYWPLGQFLCTLSHTMVFFNLITSIYTLVVISIDRFVFVRFPVWARNHRTPRRASFVVLGVWLLALVLCSANLYLAKTYYVYRTNKTYCLNHYDTPHVGERSTAYALAAVRFIVSFLIPFSVIVVCYGAIMVRLRRDQLSQSSKTFKVITAVIVAFFVCCFPYHIFAIFEVSTFNDPRKPLAVSIGFRLSSSLVCFNSCVNPILYFCMGHDFKEKLRCSLLSALANAFSEESNPSNAKADVRASAELVSHSL